MEIKDFCQSCAMPLTPDAMGTNEDGSKSGDYCSYCYENGAFTSDISMEEMIGLCAPPMVEAGSAASEEEAREMMGSFFPQLKRWKQA